MARLFFFKLQPARWPVTDLELKEKLAHIDLMLAQNMHALAQRDRAQQEMRLAPWQLALGGMAAGAGFAAALLALVKIFGH